MKKLTIFTFIFLIIILWPDFLLKSGFFYNLDSVFFPVYEFKNFFAESFFRHFWDFLNIIFWYEIHSKIYFLTTLFFWVFLGFKIWKYSIEKLEIKDKNIDFLLKFLSIIFIISNPFIYERLMSQVWIAFWVFSIWIWFLYLLEFLDKKINKKLYFSALFFALSFNIFPHSIIFVIILFFLTILFFYKKFTLKNIFILWFIFLFLNFNWLIWNFFLNSKELWVSNTISTFNRENIEVFVQNSQSNLWVELTSMLWFGFWWEKYNHVFPPENLFPLWWIFGIAIFIIIWIWAFKIFKKYRKIFYYFLSIYIIFYVLALGISSPIFAWFNEFLYKYIPFYIWMREPAKFLWMLAILNTIFFIIWIYYFWKYLEKKEILKIETSKFDFYVFLVLIFVIINAYSPWVFWAFRWQLQISKYPEEYFESKKFLEEKKEFKNVVFPWHSYVACQWGTTKVFSNTYPNILNFSETIKSDNIEIWTLYTNYNNIISKKVEEFLENKNLEILREIWVKNIVFQDYCADFEEYEFLENLGWLEKVFDEKYLKIYKIKYE